jgi:hypothetical protein
LSPFVLKYRVAVMILAIVWFALSSWRACSIQGEAYTQKYFNPGYPIQQFIDIK